MSGPSSDRARYVDVCAAMRRSQEIAANSSLGKVELEILLGVFSHVAGYSRLRVRFTNTEAFGKLVNRTGTSNEAELRRKLNGLAKLGIVFYEPERGRGKTAFWLGLLMPGEAAEKVRESLQVLGGKDVRISHKTCTNSPSPTRARVEDEESLREENVVRGDENGEVEPELAALLGRLASSRGSLPLTAAQRQTVGEAWRSHPRGVARLVDGALAASWAKNPTAVFLKAIRDGGHRDADTPASGFACECGNTYPNAAALRQHQEILEHGEFKSTLPEYRDEVAEWQNRDRREAA